MANSSSRVAKKRSLAGAAGFCITCCKRRPESNRKVCRDCLHSALERQKWRRAESNERKASQQLIAAHERAGDGLQDEHLYEAAEHQYKLALRSSAISENDRNRIEEKLTHALFLGPNPDLADEWMERVLAHTQDPAKVIDLLLYKSRQLWSKGESAVGLPILERAVQIAENSGDKRRLRLTNLRIVSFLWNLERFDVAGIYFAKIGAIDEDNDVELRRAYYALRARMHAQRGNAAEARADFDLAIQAAQQSDDAYALSNLWATHSLWIAALGEIELAKVYAERALLIVRGNQIQWLTSHMSAYYAGILVKMGDFRTASTYLLEALSCDTFTPTMETAFAENGIPVALAMRDEDLLKRCGRPRFLSEAFQTGVPSIIGPVAAAFAEMYAHQGRLHEARQLLQRVLPMIKVVDQSWDLSISVARHGLAEDIPQARTLLANRVALPSAGVAQAFLHLFDAFVAQRRKRIHEARVRATEAAQRFEWLQWHAYADRARSLLPDYRPVPESVRKIHSARLHPNLTEREREVAELIVMGHTNRAIAHKLSITEKTVETHITSIMNRLGIRSRYQVPEALPK